MGAYKGVEIPVGSTQEQIQEIIRKVDAGSSGELTPGTRKTPESTVVAPSDATDRIAKFNAALNIAVDQARQKRQDKTLDFLGGVVPKGALPATSFAQVIRSFNSDSAPLESTLISKASDFAMQQEEVKQKAKDDIKDLALAVGKAGAKQETIDAITALMDSGDVTSALKIGAEALGKTNKDIRQVGSNLVEVDTDGNVTVLYSAPSADGGGGGSTGFFKSGALKVSNSDIGDAAQQLEATRDWENKDGYANTDLYVQMYNHWIENQGLPQDFFKQFDPDYYLRPTDPGIPFQIKSVMKEDKKSDNPFE